MYYVPYMYPYQYPYYGNLPIYNYDEQRTYWAVPNIMQHRPVLQDHGKKPFVVNINQAARQNKAYRTAIWTGSHLQVTLMSIDVGENIGLEIHPDTDQFLRIEKGQGLVQMGKSKSNLNFEQHVYDGSAIMVPANTWHDVTNTGNAPLKLYSIYAPPEHPFGTVHKTKADALIAEGSYRYSSKDF